MALAVAKAGVRAPELLATAEVGPFAAVLAYRRPTGATLDPTLATTLSEEDLAAFWRLLAQLQRARIAHRGLSIEHLLLDEHDGAGLNEAGTGDIAAADLSLRLDVAQLLTTLALLVGPERAVAKRGLITRQHDHRQGLAAGAGGRDGCPDPIRVASPEGSAA